MQKKTRSLLEEDLVGSVGTHQGGVGGLHLSGFGGREVFFFSASRMSSARRTVELTVRLRRVMGEGSVGGISSSGDRAGAGSVTGVSLPSPRSGRGFFESPAIGPVVP
jgi:hypothetical protein